MSVNRKWITKEEMHLLKSSNGAVWFCRKCMRMIPYDEALDSDEARKDQMHKVPRHHNLPAVLVPDAVPVGTPAMYYIDGTIVKSEAEIIRDYKQQLVEHIEFPESFWFVSHEFAGQYKDENKSVTYYECDECHRMALVDDVLHIRRVFHCGKLAAARNKNFKVWWDKFQKENA